MILDPLIPFEPVAAVAIPDDKEWVHQVKWDGVRLLAYYDGETTALYNRRKRLRTAQYPELADATAYCGARSAIFDGEVIALDETGKPSFHQVMRRDSLRRLERLPSLRNALPVVYMVFDLLYANGRWITGKSLQDRSEQLDKLLYETENVRRVPWQTDGEGLFNAVCSQNLEGIVSKNLHSVYQVGGKAPVWRKIKHYKDVIAVVGGITYREQTVNALLLGLYNEQRQLIYIGHAGSGRLTAKDWQELTKTISVLKQSVCPFSNTPPRASETQWLLPRLTVKIQYLNRTMDGLLRQPVIQAFVIEDPSRCRLKEFTDEATN
ncbi:RNA ligase family protein [Sporolactobacillus spathodeae]|uniref:DNA ligase (ATP) n=1 Tax=Sporolactobacillus spathodeae TaxID=1465502 RepID=A0ABS2Q8C9_9BACL|nr:RNA ligase family protein [Sporolactobacillus spathodeae]MBM7658041.1 bifunctional non-homologous end joining protein LigD [Sporolactobacillus spathodeae]